MDILRAMRQPPMVVIGRSWQRRVGRALLLLQGVSTLALVAVLALAPSARAAGGQTEIASAGPLTRIIITGDLNCQVAHEDDQSFEFYGGELGSCGTFLSVGGTLFGPAVTASGSAAQTPWTPVTQTAVSGSGSGSDPFRIVTTVEAGDTGVRVEQTDSYVVGEESYRTDVRIINDGGGEQRVVLFRAADCYLQDSDSGFGRVDDGAPACVISQESDARIEQWVPITPGSRYVEAHYTTVYQLIGQQQPFPNTCTCDQSLDNGAGLSWEATVGGGGGSTTISHLTYFSPEGRRIGATPMRDAIPGPLDVTLDPVIVASSVALAAGVVFVVPFPAALFNSTLEQNYDVVSAWWGRLGRRVGRAVRSVASWAAGTIRNARSRPSAEAIAPTDQALAPEPPEYADPAVTEPPAAAQRDFWQTPLGMLAFIGLSAFFYSLLDPTFGISVESLATFLGLGIGLVLTLLAFGLPLFVLTKRLGLGLKIEALPGTLFIAVLCVVISRLADFQPGYLYGLIIGFGFSRELSKLESGRLEGIAAATSLGASIVAWIALAIVRGGSGGGFMTIVAETALATVVVAGLEGALFAMLPLRFLPGERVRAWNPKFWMGLLGVAAFAFFHILLNPTSGYLANTERSSMATVIGLLLVFGIGSVLFWAYFRFIRREPGSPPPAAQPPAEAPQHG